jgi:ribosome maturation factor RimP
MGALGLDLEAVDVSSAGRRRVLRVAVDRDGGITLDDVADATREVNRVLDEGDLMGEQPYTLEVSSPGVDRPLTLPRHWRRNQGRLVKATLAGGDTVTGRIRSSDEQGADLDVEGPKQTTHRRVTYAEVAKARVQVEFHKSKEGGH